MNLTRLKKILTKRFTFMMIPHSSGKSVQFNVPLPLLALLLTTWTGVTFWGSYLSAQHIDYWKSEVSNHVLKMKVQYLANQVEKSRGFIDEVKQIEFKLRDLLDYKNKYTIITGEELDVAKGGPTQADEKDLSQFMTQGWGDISWKRLMTKIGLLKSEANAQIVRFDDLSGWIEKQRSLFRATPRGWPCPGRLSSHFGRRADPFTGLMEYHYGVDITGPMGTPVRATGDARVRLASWHSGYGNLVVLEHKYGYQTRYAHNGRLLVKVGDTVKRGQPIALMGSTGKSSGPHCHYEVWHNKRRVNPYAYLNGDYPKIHSLSKMSALESAKSSKKS